MTLPHTDIDKLGVQLSADAEAYADKVEALASDPYFREALVKISVSGFVWALYQAFKHDPHSLAALNQELKVQSAAIDRAVSEPEPRGPE